MIRRRKRARKGSWQRDFDDMLDVLVGRALDAAQVTTYQGLLIANELSADAAYEIAHAVTRERWVIDKVVDAACDVLCEPEIAELSVAQARVTAAAEAAALQAFTLRHKPSAGSA